MGGEPALILGGPRALLMQVAHPKIAAGVADRSDFRDRPLTRLCRTMDAVLLIVFGSLAQACSAVESARKAHDQVNGRLPEAAGRWPVGAPYSAHDREVQAWVVCTLADTAEVVFERFVRSFHPGEAEQLYEDWKRFGRFFGIPDSLLPPTYPDYRAYLHRMLAGDEIHVTRTARELADYILYPRLPLLPRAAWKPAISLTTGLLPARLREEYGLRWGPREKADLRRWDRLNWAASHLTPKLRRKLPYVYVAARRVASASILERAA